MPLTEQIKQKALDLGFDLAGVTDAEPLRPDDINRFLRWLDAGYAGQMTWMHNNIDKRVNPSNLLPGAKSVIVVGLNYKPRTEDRGRKTEDGKQIMGRIAAFARYDDYHPFIKKQLRKLVDFLIDLAGSGLKFKICVDSTPLLERALAAKAGLGFIGKNHALVNPRLGPQIFLGELITNLTLESDKPIQESCPNCDKCVSACPTGALRKDGSLDAAKCISYLTIESKADIPCDLAPRIGNHLFGCAECLLACPYQQKAPSCANREFIFHADRTRIDLNELLNLTEDRFQTRFADSPIQRPGLARLKYIAAICLKNLCSSA